MTPEYSTDGQVCMIRLYARHYGPNITYVSANLPFQELTGVLNQPVPVRTRGLKRDPFDTGAAGGGVEWILTHTPMWNPFCFYFSPRPRLMEDEKEFVFAIKPESTPVQPEQNLQHRLKLIVSE
jgi:hypothetical protein